MEVKQFQVSLLSVKTNNRPSNRCIIIIIISATEIKITSLGS